jgi:hypothetical protein
MSYRIDVEDETGEMYTMYDDIDTACLAIGKAKEIALRQNLANVVVIDASTGEEIWNANIDLFGKFKPVGMRGTGRW